MNDDAREATPPLPVAVVGASGYSGEELVRLLLGHPRVALAAVTSRQYRDRTIAEVFPKFASCEGADRLRFSEPDVERLAESARLVFLALPHGVAAEFAIPLLARGCRVIDLSADFRLRSAEVYREFYGVEHPAPVLLSRAVYGLPEVYREAIAGAELVAVPGCYPTSVLLPLIAPLRAGLISPSDIVVNSLSGVSGAGRTTEVPYLFAECNESVRPYGVPKHRHLSEIEQELSLAASTEVRIQFSPHLVPVSRGIVTTIRAKPSARLQAVDAVRSSGSIGACLAEAYGQAPFVRLLRGNALPDTKNVLHTNFIEIAWRADPRTGALLLMSAEDNIVKGASGQAVQAMNILSGFPETEGLL